MDKLWAPWRMEYIKNCNKEDGCIFCNRINKTDDKKNLILYRGKLSFIIMNKFPYNNGHLMIVPNRHVGDFLLLKDEEHLEIDELIKLSLKALKIAMEPQGFNVGMNLGRIAGAGIEDHLHYHIVPRWSGDTNFMPIIGETKVISESLEQSYDKIHQAIVKLEENKK